MILDDKQSRLLGIIAEDPENFGYLTEHLQGEAQEIGKAIVEKDVHGDGPVQAVAREIIEWARRGQERAQEARERRTTS